MYTVETLAKNVIEFISAIAVHFKEDPRDVEAAVMEIDFDKMFQSIRREAVPVYRCHASSYEGDLPVYNGEKLFKQNAALICRTEDLGFGIDEDVDCSHFLELWIMEDMSLRLTSCFTMKYGDDDYFMEYRQDQGNRWPLNNVWLDLDDCLDALAGFWDVDPDEVPPTYFEP